MAPISFKDVLKVSSEDKKFPATNLLMHQKWLSDPEGKDAEAFIELAMDVPSQIHYIDIGFYNVSLMEIQVSSSSWPTYREPLCLLPTVMLQNPMDARAGRNKTGCKMFNFTEHLNQEISKLPWDKVKVILQQPHARNKQMGLEFVRLGTPRNVMPLKSTLKSNQNAANLPSSPKMSPNSEIKSTKDASPSPSSLFEAKLRNMSNGPNSSEKNVLGRTAKMVMASKRLSLQVTTKTQEKTSIEEKSLRADKKNSSFRKKLKQSDQSDAATQPSTPDIRKISDDPLQDDYDLPVLGKKCENISEATSGNLEANLASEMKPSKVRGSSIKTAEIPVQVQTKSSEKLQNSHCRKSNGKPPPDQESNLKNTSASRTNVPATSTSTTNFKPLIKVDTVPKSTLVSRNYHPNTADLSQSCVTVCQKEDSDVIVTSTQDCFDGDATVEFVEESKEVVYSDKQIRQLKKAIKRFFNSLDMDSIDPNKMKVKDLRKQFESSYNVKLNKDGRSYFRETTARFLSIVFSTKKWKEINSTESSATSIGTKRKSQTKPNPSPAKVAKQPEKASQEQAACSSSALPNMVECPLCFEYFESAVVGDHAALCGQEDDELPSLEELSRSEHTTKTQSRAVDTSENSCLTSAEQQYWINFSKEPKPYQERLNRSAYEGCMLVKCPICGQKYKESEIAAHSDDCAEKVNSGCTRMGLYLLEPKKRKKETAVSSRINISATSSETCLLD